MSDAPLICVFGAGSIGCYIGGRLLAGGAAVGFVGRAKAVAMLGDQGLRLSDLHGAELRVAAGAARFATEDPAAAADAALVLVTVKSAATESAARQLDGVLPEGTLVLSLQNGLRNAEVLQRCLPGRVVLAGMVPYNVLNRGSGAFHQGSQGELMVERHAWLLPFLPVFARAGLSLHLRDDMPQVQWGKLLLNLNNAVNALSGLPLKTELSQRAYRRCLALAQRETLYLMRRAGLHPARPTPLPAGWLPSLLSLPDAVFRRVANRMFAIDPLARSSMWEDLEAGRPTEVDWLNGEVMRLAEQLGEAAPVNARLRDLVREAERGGRRDWRGEELLAELRGTRQARDGSLPAP